jgi:hypothetical protein
MPVAPIAAPAPGPNAPPPPGHNGTAYWIKVAAQSDWIVYRDERAERLQQDVREMIPIGRY